MATLTATSAAGRDDRAASYLHYWGRWVDELRKFDGQWLFTRREVVGVGTIVPGDTERDRRHPGHPGRLPVEPER